MPSELLQELRLTITNRSAAFDEWGEKILSAIGNLDSRLSDRSSGSVFAEVPSTAGLVDGSLEAPELHISSPDIPIVKPTVVTSLPSILEWKVFAGHDGVPSRPALSLHEQERGSYASQASGRESASYSRSDLVALSTTFEKYFLPTMPILDFAVLNHYINNIGEYGIAWTAESCLVLLVAALASMHSSSTSHLSSQNGAEKPSIACTPGAIRYWIMAKKRLAWALDGYGLLAAQCQFLAG